KPLSRRIITRIRWSFLANIQDILYHTHNHAIHTFGPMAISHQKDETFTQRTFIGPRLPGHFLVDHHRRLPGNAIFLRQKPSGQELHPQGAKVIPATYSNIGVAQCDGFLASFDTITGASSAARMVDGSCRDAWNGAQT